MNKNNNICNNCGKIGHLFHQCKLPITSYGIILFRSSDKGPQYLMIRRKDSFGYIDFIRGKYLCNNITHLKKCIDEMSLIEKNKIINEPFENLWKTLWGNRNSNSQYRNEEILSSKKFEILKNGVYINGEKITLEDIVKNSHTQWDETEWEFPKGRRNFQEKDNEYYLAYMNEIVDSLDNFQKTEVSKIQWMTIDECLESIRPYHLEKKKLISNIDNILKEYRLYS